MYPPWGLIGATWRIRLNLCIPQPTRVHNRNGKWIGSAVFAQLTAGAYTLQWFPCFPSKLPLPMLASGPRGSLGPPESGTQMATLSFQPFLKGTLVWQTDRATDRPTDHMLLGAKCGLTGCIHDTAVCQTGCIQPVVKVVKPVWQPDWQQVVSCKRSLIMRNYVVGTKSFYVSTNNFASIKSLSVRSKHLIKYLV